MGQGTDGLDRARRPPGAARRGARAAIERDAAGEADVAEVGAKRAGARDVLAGEGDVGHEPLRGLLGDRRGLHADVDAAAFQAGGDQPARVDLERGQRAGQAEGDVEVAMIDRARLDE